MGNPKIGALEDLANVVYKSFMKEMPKKEKKKLKESIPEEIKDVVQNRKERSDSPAESKPRMMGISISEILSAQDNSKPTAPKKGRKKPKGRGIRDEI